MGGLPLFNVGIRNRNEGVAKYKFFARTGDRAQSMMVSVIVDVVRELVVVIGHVQLTLLIMGGPLGH